MSYYHVTERDNLESILSKGFLGNWGDVGFGVYFFDNILSANNYAKKGGWDKKIKEPVILMVDDNEIEKLIPETSWDNKDDYLAIYWFEMNEDEDEENYWKPSFLSKAGS